MMDLPASLEPILTHIEARYPLLYVLTWEERRSLDHFRRLATRLKPARNLFVWSLTEGYANTPHGPGFAKDDPLAALDFALEHPKPALFILKDFHPFLRGRQDIVRRLRDLFQALETADKTVIILSPIMVVPPELEKEIIIIDYALPNVLEVAEILAATAETQKSNNLPRLDAKQSEMLMRAFLGLTADEIGAVVRKVLTRKGTIDIKALDEIIEEKRQILRKTEIVEFVLNDLQMRQVGGLKRFKQWVDIRARGFTDEARKYGLPIPKGVLITGISGCGKSLVIKALANAWSMPLLRLDMGRIFSNLVGSPEESLRRAIMTVEAVAPAVLWIDEIEMGISVFSDSVESGSTSRIFASFLTWMQERRAAVFVAATANDIDRLPPEFIRKGRFDEVFFVDLPEQAERAEIVKIHLEIRGKRAAQVSVEGLAKSAAGFTGAEIEQAIITAMYSAFSLHRELEISDIYRALEGMVPLSVTMKEQITRMKRWADNRAVKAN